MTPQPRPERSPAREREPGAQVLRRLARLMEPAASRQARRGAAASGTPAAPAEPENGRDSGTPPARDVAQDPAAVAADPLEHPDAVLAADAAAAENLLRCWVRERGIERPDGATLLIPLAASGAALRVPVRYWSATGWHRFGTPVLAGAPAGAPAVDAVTLAALLGREAAHAQPGRPAGGHPVGESAELVARVADSARRTAAFLAARRAEPGPAPHGDRFLDAEQSLILGHPLHPTPKSREGLADGDARRFSPELRGSFRLHWLAVDRSVLAADSAWREEGEIVPAPVLATRLAGQGLRLPPDTVPLPLHPWQAREVVRRPDVAGLLADGALHDLGEHGEPWHPTSSVRTVHRPGAPAMLKLSLALRITNSRRENLRKELHRGLEVHRLLTGELGERWRAAFPDRPGFGIVRDPAWLGVDDAGGRPVPGLDVVVRHSPFGAAEDVACVASLTAPRPWPGRGEGELRSRLADVIGALAARTGQGSAAVAVEWLLRYLRAIVRPALWLDAKAGIALEAHQQNTLVLLDADGWPAGGRYRDNQGFYFRASRRESLGRLLPGIGEHSDTFVADEVATERFIYYLGINNVLGLIGALGSQGLADEALLLAAFRGFLAEEATPGPEGGPVSPLPERLLQARTLRCKANLLTRLHGLDELVGPVDGQSVYVTIPNPLA